MEQFGPVVLGIALGVLSGLFGIGGSSVATPLLRTLFHTPPLLALATPLPVTLLSIAGALWGYSSGGLVRPRPLIPAALAGAPASVLGALATKIVGGHFLMMLTGATVVYIGLNVLLFHPPAQDGGGFQPSPVRMAAIGAAVGFLSGLLANGGGVFLVPAFVLLERMTMKEAVASSLAVIAAIALPGTITHVALGHVDFALAAKLAVGMLPGSYIGSKVALGISNPTLQRLYGVSLALFGTYFLASEFWNWFNA